MTILFLLSGHLKAVSYAKFLNGDEIVSASTDSQLKLWNVKQGMKHVNTCQCLKVLCALEHLSFHQTKMCSKSSSPGILPFIDRNCRIPSPERHPEVHVHINYFLKQGFLILLVVGKDTLWKFFRKIPYDAILSDKWCC